MAAKAEKPAEKPKKHWDAKPSQKLKHTVITIVITLIIFGGGAWAYVFFVADTKATITTSPAAETIKTVEAPNSKDVQFTEPGFLFSLPVDWRKTGELTTGPYHEYSYKATLKNADNRYLDIYIDTLPLDMPVNKEVAVHPVDGKLTHGTISDNCTTFTAKPTPTALSAPARWDGVDFLCDMDSSTRNVVGTSAPGTRNKITLANPGTTGHNFFFVYTDNNYNPDYSIFYNMLDSFSVR